MQEARVAFPPSLIKRYENPRLLGEGGASTVYAAHDLNLNKEVAIKILAPSSSGQRFLRFQQEAKVISKLTHPHVVTAIDFGMVDDQIAYMVMDLVGGESLLSLIERKQPLSLACCLDLFKQICSAMAYAHAHGILHRDLKPANVLIEETAGNNLRAKVADFGVAKIAGHSYFVTTGNIFIGTPAYTSPEQFRGDEATAGSDVYSFGCLMFETLTGKLPFQGEQATELALMHANDPVPVFTGTAHGEEIPPFFQEIVHDCMIKDPEERIGSFDEVQELLGRVQLIETPTAAQKVSVTLKPNEPYLVSGDRPGFIVRESILSRQMIIAIVLAVFFIGGGICIKLMGYSLDLSFLIPGKKDVGNLSSGSVKPVLLDEDKIEANAWKLRQPNLPKSMLEGTNEELFERAQKQKDRKRYASAITFLDAILERDPDNIKALKWRADNRTDIGDTTGALADLTKVIAARPEDKKLLYKRAELRLEVNDLNGALDDISAAVKEHKENYRYWRLKGRILDLLNRRKEALADFTRAIELNDDNSDLKARAKIYQELGQDQKAIDDLDKAIEKKPDKPDSYFLRGNSYSTLGQPKKAIEDYSTGLNLERNSLYFLRRAALYERLGMKEKAAEDKKSAQIDDFAIK